MSYKCTYRFIFCLLSGLPVSFNWVVCNNPVLSAFLNWNWSLSYTAGRPRYSAHISRCVSSWAVTSGLHKHNSSIITHRNRIFWNCFCCLYQHLNYCFYFFFKFASTSSWLQEHLIDSSESFTTCLCIWKPSLFTLLTNTHILHLSIMFWPSGLGFRVSGVFWSPFSTSCNFSC